MNKLEKLRARLAEVQERLRALAEVDADELTEEQDTELRSLEDELATEVEGEARGLLVEIEREERREELRSRAEAAEQRGSRVGDAPGDGVAADRGRRSKAKDPYNLDELRFDTSGSELRARATSAIEATVGDVDDAHRQRATELIARADDARGTLAKRILATGSPAYRSAFQKVAAGYAHFLEPEERTALVRAQSLTDAAGGYAIPFTLDPTIIMTNDGAANPFRQVSRIETIVTDTWNGVSSAGVSGGYAAESSEVDDDAAELDDPSVKPERWDVFIPFTFEIGQDWANLESDLRMMVAEQRDEFDVVAFTSGTGTDEPTGIVTALDGTASEVSPATAETFASEDVYAVETALPPKYRRTSAQARWMMAIDTINTIRQFDTQGGSELLVRIAAATPQELIGYALAENSALRGTGDIDDAVTADNHIAILGDWRNFLIVDRAGMNMELVPHLFATANNRPNGRRGFLAWGRTGSGCLNINAFRALNVATTA